MWAKSPHEGGRRGGPAPRFPDSKINDVGRCTQKIAPPPCVSPDTRTTQCVPRAPKRRLAPTLVLGLCGNRREGFCWDLSEKLPLLASGSHSPLPVYELKPASVCICTRKERPLTHLSGERRPPLGIFLRLPDHPGAQPGFTEGGTWPELEGRGPWLKLAVQH